ncbi:hypothetical protein AgCh_021764 [Apium graveolens]
MVRNDKSGFKRGNARRKARSTDQGSDESDEDFIISEEELDSDEYCSSLDLDESEEALGEFLSEEEETTIKVKKPTRSKTRKTGSAKRGKRFMKRQKKKARFSNKQDDDEFTEGDDDVEFMPDESDYVDSEDETPVRKKKRVSYKEEDDDGENEEEDDIKGDDREFTLDDIIVDEEDEDDDMKEDDHEFTLDDIIADEDDDIKQDDREFTFGGNFVDEEDDTSVQKKKRKVRKPRSRGRDIVEGRRREKQFRVMKKPRSTSNKRRANRRLVRKTSSSVAEISRLAEIPCSDSDDDFAYKFSVAEDLSKRIPIQRRRKLVADSDSDFICSSADDVCTNLEEKRLGQRLVGDTSSGNLEIPSLARERSSGRGGEFANKSLLLEDRSKKILGRRRKNFLPCSGSESESEFLRFASSDEEYTIPKEEKEYHRLVDQSSSIIVPNHCSRRKTSTGSDGANKSLEVEDTSKNIPSRRRKYLACSDSDFICSESSDYEYTISEEEREHADDADKPGYSLKTNLRSSSSLKKIKEEKGTCKKRKRPERKGKEKMEDIEKVLKQVCGICLSEEGKRTIRGTLNCCSHFFCFACIMEWSKIESRCPLCKQRFVTVSKPAAWSDLKYDLRALEILIPERDQVYQPSEEELRGYLDPYDGVICTECLQGGDDALMLLCDICDSPAHTYCVGLGREVPSGDWFCEGCRLGTSSAPHIHGLNSVVGQRESNNLSGMSSPVHNVGELDLNSLYVPETPLTQQAGPFPIPRRFGSEYQAASPTYGSGAFTVFDRRRIQRQIHNLLSNRRIHPSIQPGGMPSTTSGIRLFGSQIDGGTGLTIQRTLTPETRASQYSSHERFQDNTTGALPDMNASSARSIQPSEPRGQNHEHVGGSMSFNPFNSRLGYDHLHLCSSRSNIDSDGSSHAFRETTIPSRTSQ